MEHKHGALVLNRKSEADVEQLPSIELASIVALLDDVDLEESGRLEQKGSHVRHKPFQLLRSLLPAAHVSEGNNNRNSLLFFGRSSLWTHPDRLPGDRVKPIRLPRRLGDALNPRHASAVIR